MITPATSRDGRYNRWQNQNLYGAAERLSDEQRKDSAAPSSAPSTARSTTSCGATRSG